MAYAGATTPKLISEISQLLADRIAGLDDTTADQLAVQFACHGRAAGPLRDYLRQHDRVLHEPVSDLPKALIHIAYALTEAGHPGIALPVCLDCGAATPMLRNAVPGGRVCDTCHHARSLVPCTGCGKPINLTNSVTASAGLCRACRAKARPMETCAGCARRARIKVRQADGTGLCRVCWNAPTAACTRCGTVARVYQRAEDGPLCRSCYVAPTTACVKCGRIRPVHARSADGPVCASCHQRPLHECGRCGAIAVWHSRPRDGQPGYCVACHERTRRRLEPCPACGDPRVLIGDAAGVRICARCADLDYDYTCQHCGAQGKFPIARTCYSWLAEQRVRDLLADSGRVPTRVASMTAALLAAGTGEAVWRWLSPKRGTAALITAIVNTDQSVDHDLLDTLPQGHLLHRLRAVLVTGGVLPDRPEFLDRIDPWLEPQLADRLAAHSHLIRTWARWTLQRRARRRLSRRPFTEAAAHYQRSCLTAAIRLLAWLDEHHLTLADLTQPDIDRWLADNPHEYAYLAKEFLRWARNRRLVGEVAITERGTSHNPTALSEGEHWHYLRRCLGDETLPLDVRAAGSLILLYGMTTARISRLRRDELETDGTQVWLHLGRHRLRVMAQAGQLVLDQAAAPQQPRPSGTVASASIWLFPGGQPGRHTVTLHRRLVQHGLPRAAHGRAAALIHLAGDLPAPVLVDLLGISIDTANQWAKHASSDWAAYLDTRQEP